ncbi:hypothetical protein [Luteibaculum oceani]|uniref:Outer membrane beta-barrel protein n=1 Tax=Luteibaculum oceani TaxID=1294296 RepID=A0A5C6V1T7_9FLAO|nr:hypothetical protein [Luteibaculum oceani]TXC78651.1 hypothetical protein FRX97_08005 [Luteibaculum oceani]
MRLFLTLVFALFCSISFSQSKGQLLLGGGLFYDGSTQEDSVISNQTRLLSISPLFGLMVSDRIATGVLLDYRVDVEKVKNLRNNAENKDSQKTMFIGAFGRLHGNFTDRVLYIAQLDLGKVFYLNGFTPHPIEYDANLKVGLMYFIAKRASLGLNIATLNYSSTKIKDSKIKESNLRIDYNVLNPRFEVIFYL